MVRYRNKQNKCLLKLESNDIVKYNNTYDENRMKICVKYYSDRYNNMQRGKN